MIPRRPAGGPPAHGSDSPRGSVGRRIFHLLGPLLILLTWDPLPPGTGVDRIEATAWVRVPVRIACTDPDTGLPDVCLAGYVTAWEETVTVSGTATGLTWTVPDFPSGSVAYIPLEVRTGRPLASGGVCWSGP